MRLAAIHGLDPTCDIFDVITEGINWRKTIASVLVALGIGSGVAGVAVPLIYHPTAAIVSTHREREMVFQGGQPDGGFVIDARSFKPLTTNDIQVISVEPATGIPQTTFQRMIVDEANKKAGDGFHYSSLSEREQPGTQSYQLHPTDSIIMRLENQKVQAVIDVPATWVTPATSVPQTFTVNLTVRITADATITPAVPK